MGIFSKFSSIFGSAGEHTRDTSPGQLARDRLTVVLMHDRADISPGMMENMKHDIIEVIKKYVDIDEAEIDLALENEEDSVALVANIPIMTVLRRRRQGR
ncbi:MAG: cell division topological specificity factor MinE [Synergistaceae bacterium]|nr:cell division topological specificity factor MinE [Synergistaceae bacterium]